MLRLAGTGLNRSPAIYWTDFLASLAVGNAAAAYFLFSRGFDGWQAIAFPVACAGLYRTSLFIHEAVHLRAGELPGFRTAWDVLAGIPMLMPTFTYETHLDHHRAGTYGTKHDGEYLPLAQGAAADFGNFCAQVFLQPPLVFLRFAVLAPLSFLHPRLRRWTLERASSLVINFRYRREIPSAAPRRLWALIDLACCARAWLFLMPVILGWAPGTQILRLLALAIGTLGLNFYRTLAAHRYRNPGRPFDHVEQMLDSTNITGVPVLTELVCPLGLRYHALHHLLPTVPYHHLGKVHRRLLHALPADSPYHATVFPSTLAAIRDLVRAARRDRSQVHELPDPSRSSG